MVEAGQVRLHCQFQKIDGVSKYDDGGDYGNRKNREQEHTDNTLTRVSLRSMRESYCKVCGLQSVGRPRAGMGNDG